MDHGLLQQLRQWAGTEDLVEALQQGAVRLTLDDSFAAVWQDYRAFLVAKYGPHVHSQALAWERGFLSGIWMALFPDDPVGPLGVVASILRRDPSQLMPEDKMLLGRTDPAILTRALPDVPVAVWNPL